MRAELDSVYGKIGRVSLSEEVAERIQRLILDQALGVGTLLPSESSLADTFGVSRTVIREALKVLQAKSLVEIRPGKGTVVRSPGGRSVSETLKLYLTVNARERWYDWDALYEIRDVLECRIAELAAVRRTEEDLKALSNVLDIMKERQDDPDEWTRADLKFHWLLARATGNELFSMLLNPVTELMAEVIRRGLAEPRGSERGLASHTELLATVKDGDPVRARDAMAAHIEDSRQRVKRLIETQVKTEDTSLADSQV